VNYLQSRTGNLESVRRDGGTVIVWRNRDETADQALACWRSLGDCKGVNALVIGWQDPFPAAEETNGGRGGPVRGGT
jgi:hypothetical protein